MDPFKRLRLPSGALPAFFVNRVALTVLEEWNEAHSTQQVAWETVEAWLAARRADSEAGWAVDSPERWDLALLVAEFSSQLPARLKDSILLAIRGDE